MKIDLDEAIVCVLGLGYVGLPLVQAFSRSLEVIGFDIDGNKVRKLSQSNTNQNLTFTADPRQLKQADFVIIAVPTPVTKTKEPDLSYVKTAAEITKVVMCPAKVETRHNTVFVAPSCPL